MIQVNIGRKDITLSFESPAFRCHNTFDANGRPNTRETRLTQRSATLCSLNRSSISHSLFMSLFVRWSGGRNPLSNLFVRETFTNWWVPRIICSMQIVTMVTSWQANGRGGLFSYELYYTGGFTVGKIQDEFPERIWMQGNLNRGICLESCILRPPVTTEGGRHLLFWETTTQCCSSVGLTTWKRVWAKITTKYKYRKIHEIKCSYYHSSNREQVYLT